MPEDDDQLSLTDVSPEELEPVGGESEDDLPYAYDQAHG